METRKISVLGDSITEGACASKEEFTFVNRLSSMLNCEVKNYGKGGTRIAGEIIRDYKYYGEPLSVRYKTVDPDSDLVFVFGGTNDYGHGDAPLGEKDDDTIYTFSGAMNVLIKGLVERFGKEKIIFILPTPRINQDCIYGEFMNTKNFGYPLSRYVDIMIERLEFYGIEYIDFFHHSPLPAPTSSEPTEYLQDGLHPTDKGHELIAKALYNYIKSR